MKILVLCLIAFLAVSYFFWAHYLIFSAFKASKDAGRAIPKIAIAMVAPILIAGFSIDVVYNATLGSLLFLELPRTWTLTARCGSHLKDEPWRGALARWLCSNLLDPFQSGGHCRP